MIEYLTELLPRGSEAIIAEAMKDPKLKKGRTAETCTAAVLKVVASAAQDEAKSLVREAIQNAYDLCEIRYGDRKFLDGDEAVEFDADIGTALEEDVFAEYKENLSNDWLATFDEIALHEDGGAERLATSFAKELYKQLCWQAGNDPATAGKLKTPAQILSNAGITPNDIVVAFNLSGEPVSASSAEEHREPPGDIDGVVSKLFERVGKDYVADDVRSEVELLVDSEDILANGAAARLGLDESDVATCQALSIDEGDANAVEIIMTALDAARTGVFQSKPLPGKPGRKPATEAGTGSPVPAAALAALVAHGGSSATVLAEGIGVSRATFNNYCNDKTPFIPTEDQRAYLRGVVTSHRDSLDTVLDELDE
jgi:hypothetical protein